MSDRVYLSPPHLDGDERDLVAEAFDSNWIAPLGPHVDAFEAEVATAVGVGHGAALSSGTAALHLAMILAGVEPEDEVLCSDLTFAATANAITYVGATPVFIDAAPSTWNLDPELLEEELRARGGRMPRAVIAVDLYGQCADYQRLEEICARHGVTLIEDAAESLGSTYRDRPAGSFGKLAVLSFNGNKIITTGGGGMLVSDDESLVSRARFLASQARDPAPHYEHSKIGFNYRLSNILAAIGRGQLRKLGQRVSARRANYAAYTAALSDLPGVEFMPEAAYGTSNRWLTCMTVTPEEFGASRDDIRLALEAQNIEARPVWKPMHLQPVFRDCRSLGGAVGADLFTRGLCLPSGSSLTESDLARVVDIVRGCCRSAPSTP